MTRDTIQFRLSGYYVFLFSIYPLLLLLQPIIFVGGAKFIHMGLQCSKRENKLAAYPFYIMGVVAWLYVAVILYLLYTMGFFYGGSLNP